MPELPEVETVRRGLAAHVVGRRIERVEVGRERTVRRTSAAALVRGLTGSTIVSAGRRGKYLLCPLDTGDTLMVHLRMTGQLLLADPAADRPAHTHVAMVLGPRPGAAAGAELWFVDPRTFGELVVFDPDRAALEVPELARLGVDPLTDEWEVERVAGLLDHRRTRLKPVLLDQHVIAGIGNIYADEILHAARLHPDTPARAVGRAGAHRLHAATTEILTAAVAARGSTLRDAQYVDLMGSGGSYQDQHRVYGRGGQRCVTCRRGVIRRIVSAGRSTHFCPVCQRTRPVRPGVAVPTAPARPSPRIRRGEHPGSDH